MSSTHGNDRHGPLRLTLTEEERESAREVIATLLDEAGGLSDGVLARLWKAHAQELCAMCLPLDRLVDALELRRAAPAPIGDAFPVSCSCGQPADGIDERGNARCAACAEGGES